nr:PKD domain-containing protein [uncultured Carboxylicivirga sp.]
MRSLLVINILLSITSVAKSQFILDFTSDIENGCSPIVVSFENTSTYPENAQYFWEFGNGNTSTEKNPQTSYINPGSYNITLQVEFNGVKESISKNGYIQIYAAPDIDFSLVDSPNGCVPFKIRTIPFSSEIEAITKYSWSFGDGYISNLQEPEHIYNIQGDFSITLIVENEFGCKASVTKNQLVSTYKPIAKFGVNNTYGCYGVLNVDFNNLSESVLDYSSTWSYGDNESSSRNSPEHTYTSKGIYDVSLKIVDELGCTDSIGVDRLITVEKVQASFSISKDTICLGETLKTSNFSTDADTYLWSFDGNRNSTEYEPETFFNQYGNHSITLTASRKNCQSDTTVDITVEFVEANFSPLDTFLCKAEELMFYNDMSVNAVEWNWRFGYGATSSNQNPVVLIPNSKELQEEHKMVYTDTLTVTSKHGCRNTKVAERNITIQTPQINLNGDPISGCAPVIANLSANVIYDTNKDTIKTQFWYVNTQSVSTENTYQYTQSEIGFQSIVYEIETEYGCVFTSNIRISAGEKLTPTFTIDPAGPICASETVILTGSVEEQDKLFKVFWDLDDNSEIMPSQIMPHAFQDTGYMNITFGVDNYGCYSSITKDDAIYVKGPFVQVNVNRDCENPLDYSFNAEVKGAESFYWNFNDGSALLYDNANPAHTYEQNGDYPAIIIADNLTNGCSFESKVNVKVRDLQARFSYDPIMRCLNSPITFDPTTTDDNYYFSYNNQSIEYLFLIDNKPYVAEDLLTYAFKEKGNHDVSLVVHDVNQCVDTLTKAVHIFHPDVDFESNYKIGCMPVTFEFVDKTLSDTILQSWNWSFGDGGSSIIQSPEHDYMEFGKYNVTLTVQDAEGCTASLEKKEDILAILPGASFTADDSTACINQEINLFENTQSQIKSYKWYIDDVLISEEESPIFIPVDTGYYKVALEIIDDHGCEASKIKSNFIHIQKPPIAEFNSSSTYSDCYPFLVQFYDDSQTDYPGTWNWLFDEGNNKSVLQNPSFIYSKPGNYDVTLISFSSYGCSDTITKPDYIHVKGPYAVPVIQDTICTFSPTHFTVVDTVDIYEIAWDLGDGNLRYTHELDYTYNYAGHKYPSLIIKSDSIGTCNILIQDTVYVMDFSSDFILDINPNSGCIPLNADLINQSSNANVFEWFVNDESSSVKLNHSININKAGVTQVHLVAKNSLYACIDTSSIKTIEAFPPPIIETSADTLICLGDQIIIKAKGGVQYQWSPVSGLDDSLIDSPIAQPDISTGYSVLVTDENKCFASDTVFIEVQQIPYISFEDTTIFIGETVNITVPHKGLLSAEWKDLPGLSCLNCFTNTLQPLLTTEYQVWITDSNNCFTVNYPYLIEVIKKYSVDVPSAFTPNGDGINDLLFVKGWGIKQLIEFKVFNRFGEMVYESNELEKGWDGIYKGSPLPTETYQYLLQVLTYDNEVLKKSGSIKIIR